MTSAEAVIAPSGHRPRWRAYLLLSRVSNLPTVWTNVLAGMGAAGLPIEWSTCGQILAAASCFYTGGMFLNDAFDAPFDQAARPERPIPSGDVSRSEAFMAGGAMLLVGELLLVPWPRAAMAGLLLAAAIVLYDYHHKGNRVGPLVMGACRGLVYCVAAAAAGVINRSALVGGVLMMAYVGGLTLVARRAGRNARWLVPLLIAAISLVDAAFIVVVTSSGMLATVAVAAFALTLFLQRYVPGD